MKDSVPSNLITLQSARELIGSGSIDGKRLPLIAFMEAQQAEIERLRGRALDLEALALCVLSVEENCANAERYPNGCGECIYCQSAALMLTRLPAETAAPSQGDCLHMWTVRSMRDPQPDHVCAHGCGFTWKQRCAQELRGVPETGTPHV